MQDVVSLCHRRCVSLWKGEGTPVLCLPVTEQGEQRPPPGHRVPFSEP